MKEDKVSIIIPVYKVESNDLRKCIESIMSQTYKNIEIILIDDESPDDCGKICDEYTSIDDRIQVVHQKNQGVSVARNNGLNRAKGNWIIFVDSDDWLEENMVEVLLRKAQSGNYDITICSAYVNYVDSEIKNSFFNVNERIFRGKEKNEIQLQLICKGVNEYYPPEIGCGVPWAKIYKKSFLDEKHLTFNPRLIRMQDNVFNLYAIEEADSIYYFNDYLYHYRKNQQSACNKYNVNVISYFENVNEETKKFIENYNKGELFYDALNCKIVMSFHSYFLLNFFNEKNKKGYLQIRKEICALLDKEEYKKALKNVKFKYLLFLEKIFVICLKCKFVFILKILMKMKEIRNKIERKNLKK